MAYRELIDRWGIDIKRPLLRQALTHRSFAFEHDEPHNERLEFLGDSILGLIVAEKVYREYPEASEGDMSRMKTYAVSERALADIARELDLGESIRLGKGEKLTGGADKDSILSDTVEALIAATYLQHGMEPTRQVVDRLVTPKIRDASVLGPNLDWQTSFEELAHARGMEGIMTFEMESSGPDHARVFTATGFMGGQKWGSGQGSSQKKARQKAAEASFRMITASSEKH
ncbi:MAG: ribonuclease III [Ancrocorticia sp.]|nr:ribonuclease III [Ancrocorticia sp.]MCI1895777.1 ribonuclease III [Ancrocorticia sp.]MCI1932771.1 ribonuclease III [Ancrocorticia sp.]MCI1964194.1 ribonuclease III [Ancrocorticia sp.]MCI2013318.1 ribonuclease III [Ancrocorticia sp.]